MAGKKAKKKLRKGKKLQQTRPLAVKTVSWSHDDEAPKE
jgi:hypothetical protein